MCDRICHKKTFTRETSQTLSLCIVCLIYLCFHIAWTHVVAKRPLLFSFRHIARTELKWCEMRTRGNPKANLEERSFALRHRATRPRLLFIPRGQVHHTSRHADDLSDSKQRRRRTHRRYILHARAHGRRAAVSRRNEAYAGNIFSSTWRSRSSSDYGRNLRDVKSRRR